MRKKRYFSLHLRAGATHSRCFSSAAGQHLDFGMSRRRKEGKNDGVKFHVLPEGRAAADVTAPGAVSQSCVLRMILTSLPRGSCTETHTHTLPHTHRSTSGKRRGRDSEQDATSLTVKHCSRTFWTLGVWHQSAGLPNLKIPVQRAEIKHIPAAMRDPPH